MKKLIIIFLLCLVSVAAQAQDYRCSFLNLIIGSIEQQNYEYSIYSSTMNNRTKLYKNITHFEHADLIHKVIDSLTNCCNFQYFFDDTLFHINRKIVIIDTFNFFNNYCIANKKYEIAIINNLLELSCLLDQYDVIELKSINVLLIHKLVSLNNLHCLSLISR